MFSFAKEIKTISIEEELKRSYLDYAMSVIIERALPDVRDGLKPVHRRVLFAMSILNNNYNGPYKKSARIVGDVIGKYHPHGDSAVYDTIVRMAQSFSLRYILIDGQGNFGSIDGDSAAAMRYTEIRMTKIANELLTDIEKNTVDYVSNYDDTEQIPCILPARIPNLLINGSSGIAVGMATNIPPHNLSEVINGCLALIKDNNISVKELMKYISGPDFPTYAIINGVEGIKEAYNTGKGKIQIRARTKIEKDNKTGRIIIVVYEIPYQVNKSKLVEKIAKLVKYKKIEGIYALRDESDKDGMRIVIEIKRDIDEKVVLNNLYSMTQLQISFGINMVALDNGKPKTLSLKDILSAFILHRQEVITRRTIFELYQSRERAHILEAMSVALKNIEKIIKLIKNSITSNNAKNVLIKNSWDLGEISKIIVKHDIVRPKWLSSKCGIHNSKYYLSDKQAQSILDLRLQKLTSLEHKKLLNEYKDILIKIEELISILQNPNKLIDVIRKELIIIKEKYKDPRRTEILYNTSNIDVEDLISKEDVVITLSNHGYVKYQPLIEYEAQRRGGKGKSAANIKEKDFIDRLLVANTHDTIMLFSSLGRMYCMKVHQLPEASRGARGKPIVNILPLNIKEKITAILPIHKYKRGLYVFMATANGIVKKTSLINLSKPRNSGIIAINLHDEDKLIGVNLTNGKDEIMLFSANGKIVRFPESQVRSMGRSAIGIKGINLLKNDKVVSLIVPKNNKTILTVTKYGYGKRTSQNEYPTKSRATKGVISIKINKRNGSVVGAIQVNNNDQIILITNAGTLVRIRASEVGIISRNTQGVTLIKTSKNEKVVALQRVVKLI